MDTRSAITELYISKSKIKNSGRGVFAGTNFKNGDLIESCPYIEIPKEEIEDQEKSILINYFYYFGAQKERFLIALGFGSIYNHSYAPNAKYKINAKKKVIDFIALRNIKKGEEITVNYNQGSPNSAPLWFE